MNLSQADFPHPVKSQSDRRYFIKNLIPQSSVFDETTELHVYRVHRGQTGKREIGNLAAERSKVQNP
jgi:hypothetical protein